MNHFTIYSYKKKNESIISFLYFNFEKYLNIFEHTVFILLK